MADEQKLQRLRRFNGTVQADRPQFDENLETSLSGPADVVIGHAVELESIVLRRARPLLAIKNNEAVFDRIDEDLNETWVSRLAVARPVLEKAIRTVGRIELTGFSYDWVGTGWLVAENILVTNRHVAELFAQRVGEEFSFTAGVDGPITAEIDFRQEFDDQDSLLFKLRRVLHIESRPGPDVAFLEIETHSGDARLATPIELATTIVPNLAVATIGYLTFDSRSKDSQWMGQIYGNLHDKKTLAPGFLTRLEDMQLCHDCIVPGSNSGALVVDLDSGQAVGLHASGGFLMPSYAVRSDIIQRMLADVRARTQVSGKSIRTLKILSVELENIRCFDSITIDFSEDGKPRPWTMLLGDNGLGKTTILRSIAMALCDQTGASGLMGRMSGELLRQGMTEGRIRVQLLSSDPADPEIWAETKLTRNSDQRVDLSQTMSPFFPREALFVCAYGALRNGFGSESYSGYAITDAVMSLFDPKALLQNPELALRRLMSAGADMERICRQIEKVLRLPPNSTEFGQSGLSIKGNWGPFVPVGAIGDGYLATLAWLSDLLGWTFLYNPDLIKGQVSGVVVIDEIEKHLHPRWQREIVLELSRQFPQVQFIASSHSPLCAGGLSDLEEGHAAMYRFEQTSNTVLAEKLEPYRGWTYDQIMTSSAFGLKSARDLTTQRIVEELNDARVSGNETDIKVKEEALESRSVMAADDQRDAALQTKLRRDIEELQRRVDAQKDESPTS